MLDDLVSGDLFLALIYINAFSDHEVTGAWKSFSWEIMDRLHKEGYISDPKSKAKSVNFSKDGLERTKNLFEKYFNLSNP